MYYFTGRLIISYRFLDIFTVAEYMINDKELNFASSGQDDAKYKIRRKMGASRRENLKITTN